jgi:hypothetical protein
VEYFEHGIAFLVGLFQLGTVAFLCMGPVRRYGFVLAYCSIQLLTSLTEIWIMQMFGGKSKYFRIVFWSDEIALDLLLFFILILLTYRAMEGGPGREKMRRGLAVIAVIVMALPFVLFKGAFDKPAWFNNTSQLLNFGAALLNLGLWTALLGSKTKDRQLLAVSSAFGIVATGVAISFGFRRLIHHAGPALAAADLVFVFAHLAGAGILCWAFRPVRAGITRGVPVSNGFPAR